MAKMTYAEQLKHPNWQRRRLEALKAARFECQNCGEKEITLHVHHRRYVKGRMVWEYSDEELRVLCERCHAEEHTNRELFDRLLIESCGGASIDVVVALLGGYLDGECEIDPGLAEMARQTDPYSFEIGQLASFARGDRRDLLAKAARVLVQSGDMTPAQQQALRRWEQGD